MATYTANELKNGLKVLVDQVPCSIIESEFVKPGKGQAFTRVKIRNLLNDRVVERTYKSNETVESADIVEYEMQYLYCDGESWHFMVSETFEQYAIREAAMKEAKQWLKGQEMCLVTLWNNEALFVVPPTSVILTVTETDPGLKGDTSGGGGKPATLETGAIVRVPLFVQQGEGIKINTRTGEYISRAKE